MGVELLVFWGAESIYYIIYFPYKQIDSTKPNFTKAN